MRMLAKTLSLLLAVAVALTFACGAFAEEAATLPAEAAAPAQPAAPAETQTVASEPSPAPEAEATPSPEATQVPEATDAPADPAAPEATETPAAPEATEDPEATQAPEEDILPDAAAGEESQPDLSNVSIHVMCLNSGRVRLGDTITLSAQISGLLDGIGYTMQWQYLSGGEWHDQSGANDATYSFILTRENASYQWRLVLTIA